MKIKNQTGTSDRRKIAKAVKKARKEGEKEAGKKMLKANKAKVARVLKANRSKINRLLKANNARVKRKIGENNIRITEVLRGVKRRRRPAAERHPVENPFDTRRFSGQRKKETFEQRMKRVAGDVHTVRDHILYGIANGSYKFKWSSVAKETGYKEGERKKMISLLDNKGYTVEGLAHRIWEENDGSYGHGPSDDAIRDQIIDVLQTVSSRTDALNRLDRVSTPF
jgi:hypothetical protein